MLEKKEEDYHPKSTVTETAVPKKALGLGLNFVFVMYSSVTVVYNLLI